MSLLPTSTNDQYQGPRFVAYALILMSFATLIPACIHTFLPDGGANAIAGLGLDLDSERGRQVVSLFAWAGATQFAWGLVLLAIGLRYRSFVPLAFVLLFIERTLHLWAMWGPKSGDHHPPEAHATLVMVPLFAALALLSLRRTG